MVENHAAGLQPRHKSRRKLKTDQAFVNSILPHFYREASAIKLKRIYEPKRGKVNMETCLRLQSQEQKI